MKDWFIAHLPRKEAIPFDFVLSAYFTSSLKLLCNIATKDEATYNDGVTRIRTTKVHFKKAVTVVKYINLFIIFLETNKCTVGYWTDGDVQSVNQHEIRFENVIHPIGQ